MSMLPIIENGLPALDIALIGTLYFGDGHTKLIRNGIATFLREYAALCGDNLRRADASANTDVYMAGKPIGLGTIDTMVATIQGAHEMAPWEFFIKGDERPKAASQFFITALGASSWQQNMGQQSTLYFRLPWTWYATHGSSFPELFHRACSLVRPNHGFGGLGFAYSPEVNEMRAMARDIYYIAKHTPAFVVENYIFDEYSLGKGTREGNWLTVLHDRWLDKIGGRDSVITALGPDFTCRPYEDGMTIQAGAEPNPGGRSILQPAPPDPEPTPDDSIDHGVPQVDAAARYPLYHRLNQVLKPIRVRSEDFQGGLQVSEDGNQDYFDHDRTIQWMARFD